MSQPIENKTVETADQAVKTMRRKYFLHMSGLVLTIVLCVYCRFIAEIADRNAPYSSSSVALVAAVLTVLPYVLYVFLGIMIIVHLWDWPDYSAQEAKLRDNSDADIVAAMKYHLSVLAFLGAMVAIIVGTTAWLGYNYLESVRNQAWEYMRAGDFRATEQLLEHYPVYKYRDNGEMRGLAESLRYRSERDFSLADYCASGTALEGLSEDEQERLDKYIARMEVAGDQEWEREFAARRAEKEKEKPTPVASGSSSHRTHHWSSYDEDDEEDWDGEEYINEDYDDWYEDELFYDEIMDE